MQADSDRTDIDRLYRGDGRQGQAGIRIDCPRRRCGGGWIDIRINDKINAPLVRIAFLGFAFQRFDHLAQGKVVKRDLVNDDAIEFGINLLPILAGMNQAVGRIRVGDGERLALGRRQPGFFHFNDALFGLKLAHPRVVGIALFLDDIHVIVAGPAVWIQFQGLFQFFHRFVEFVQLDEDARVLDQGTRFDFFFA